MPPESHALVSVDQAAGDDAACRRLLASGSRSFATAAWLLPSRLRVPTAAFYAFCRVADDAIDLGDDPQAALVRLHAMLDRVYANAPADDVVERSLCRCVHTHGIVREVPEALLDGFARDSTGAAIEDLDALLAYAVRVAASVGIAMTAMMGVHDADTLARACDLGVAMQLTNIARDVGEDARNGRAYLPRTWLAEAGIDRDAWLRCPAHSPALASVVERVLALADRYYAAAEPGIDALPADCRPAMRAASRIYADIGRDLRAHGCDAMSRRAHVGTVRKLLWLLRSRWHRGGRAGLDAPALPQAQFLIAAASAVQ
ncbi:MAG: phytoene/squalene synthase family protein [Deltaproteobacteria bacterium]|nr:phytoene/squalene synthase family protein [Deltaproteobacteria bacterium]